MTTLEICNARALDGAPVDVRVEHGRIAAIGASLSTPPGTPDGASQRIDAQGALLLPGLVESHTHLDKTVWGMPWYVNECGSRLIDRIDNERQWRASSGHDAGAASLALGRAFLAAGTTRLRTHVDIDTDAGLRHLDGVLATRETLADTLDMQIVAFPQSGVLDRAGTVELLDASVRMCSAGSTRAPSTVTRRRRSMPCSRWRTNMDAPSISICTSPARWACSRSS